MSPLAKTSAVWPHVAWFLPVPLTTAVRISQSVMSRPCAIGRQTWNPAWFLIKGKQVFSWVSANVLSEPSQSLTGEFKMAWASWSQTVMHCVLLAWPCGIRLWSCSGTNLNWIWLNIRRDIKRRLMLAPDLMPLLCKNSTGWFSTIKFI